ncbi:MAG: TIM-barrel domain-containing protein [Kiritimatiellia bacterium]
MKSLPSFPLEIRLLEDASLELVDCERGERLLIVPGARLLLPGFAADATLVDACVEGAEMRLRYAASSLGEAVVILRACDPGFSIEGVFVPAEDVELERLEIVPKGTQIACYEIRAFRFRHGTERSWPDCPLETDFEIDTTSCDWQFAPHPTALLFARHDTHLFLGATCAPVGGYGLHAKGSQNRFDELFLDYGQEGWGMELPRDEPWRTPVFRLFVERTADTYATYARFGEILVREGAIPDPARRSPVPWHREHVYCTWIDQMNLASIMTDAEVKRRASDSGDMHSRTALPLDEAMVREAAALILREKLPIRSILLDGGWSINSADYRADPVRFPDLRRLVDDLHALGFKVLVWWSWAEVRGAAGEAALGIHNAILDGKRNRHGSIIGDFSKKSTQEEYLRPMFRRLFSSDPGCYDLDGIKTDYMADKVHPDMPAEDPAWRGEENYILRLYRFCMGEMRRHKPDAMHIGAAGNYFLAEVTDVNRTFDVAGDLVEAHVERARMLAATTPGVPPVFDMHIFRTRRRDYLRAAKAMGLATHVGELFTTRDDLFAPVTKMDEADYRELREEL